MSVVTGQHSGLLWAPLVHFFCASKPVLFMHAIYSSRILAQALALSCATSTVAEELKLQYDSRMKSLCPIE